MSKPIICLDFDGVIHSYHDGWRNGEIYGHVVPGFFTWASYAKENFQLIIYSSRSKTPKGIEAMSEWLAKQFIAWPRDPNQSLTIEDFSFTHEKPPAFITIDDRAITFKGQWLCDERDPARLIQFKPWMQT